jgi:hypothetical protein
MPFTIRYRDACTLHTSDHFPSPCRITAVCISGEPARLKTLAAIDRGIPRKEVQELFGVSCSTIKRLSQQETPHRGRPDDEDPRQALG